MASVALLACALGVLHAAARSAHAAVPATRAITGAADAPEPPAAADSASAPPVGSGRRRLATQPAPPRGKTIPGARLDKLRPAHPAATRTLPTAGAARAAPSLQRIAAERRAEEIARCPAGDVPTWGDGVDRPAVAASWLFVYRPEHAPGIAQTGRVLAMIERAAAVWAQCGLALRVVPWSAEQAARDDARVVVVAWMDAAADDGSVIGKADRGNNHLWLSARVLALVQQRNPTLLDDTLQMTLSHEMGHFLGLVAHSRRCVDVTSYYTGAHGAQCLTGNAEGIAAIAGLREYRSLLPTACDIARCRKINARPPLPDGRLYPAAQ